MNIQKVKIMKLVYKSLFYIFAYSEVIDNRNLATILVVFAIPFKKDITTKYGELLLTYYKSHNYLQKYQF